jgi:hypothetical protein
MSIRRYLPPKGRAAGYVNLQVKMETSIVEEVRSRMRADGVSWNELLTACFRAYLDESKKQFSESTEARANKTQTVSILIGVSTISGLLGSPLLQLIGDYLS